MSIVADKIACRCGKGMIEVLETVQWNDKQGNEYIIHNVPTVKCTRNGCEEEYRTAYVELNTSMIADDMRSGILGKTTNYYERY